MLKIKESVVTGKLYAIVLQAQWDYLVSLDLTLDY